MPDYVCKFDYRNVNYKWSNTIVRNFDTAQLGITYLKDIIMPLLLPTLDQITSVIRVSVANVDGGRDADTKELNLPGTQSSPNISWREVVEVAGKFVLRGEEGAKRNWLHSGVTDSACYFDAFGNPVREAAFATKSDALFNHFRDEDFLIEARIPETEVGYGWSEVTKIEPVADSNNLISILTTAGAHGLTIANMVYVGGSKKTLNLRPYLGEWRRIRAVTDTTITLAGKYEGQGTSILPKDMRIRKLEHAYRNITSWDFVDWSTRQRKSLEGSRGAEPGYSYR